ncbi:MAG: threonylcarbamoyl-AMP synthase, partial [Holophagales bacterium]|nr:threonylcarbamoyl-AMP synthase [Holophagales bacterium]
MTLGQSAGCGTEVLDGRNQAAISKAAGILKSGGLVAFPTETVYGLGADGLNQNAVEKIYEAKGRPKTNPLILHVADVEAAAPLVADWPRMAQELADKYWPGPLTIVLQASDLVPEIVRAGNPTVALRSPAHPVALDLLRRFNGPLAAPSANRAAELSPTKSEHVVKALGGAVGLVLDGGPTRAGIESTIISLAETPPRVLRPGPISISELEETIGPVAVFCGAVERGATQAAPGMSSRHYAPKAQLSVHGL